MFSFCVDFFIFIFEFTLINTMINYVYMCTVIWFDQHPELCSVAPFYLRYWFLSRSYEPVTDSRRLAVILVQIFYSRNIYIIVYTTWLLIIVMVYTFMIVYYCWWFIHLYNYRLVYGNYHMDTYMDTDLSVMQHSVRNWITFCFMLPCAKNFKSGVHPARCLQMSKSFSISLLLAFTNENIVINLLVYLHKAFKLHSILSA